MLSKVHEYDPQREKEMINQLLDKNKGPFNDNVIKQLFKEILKPLQIYKKSENENIFMYHVN